MHCYLTRTASFLPGPAVDNRDIQNYLGTLEGEEDIRQRVLTMNGIKQRHYAQNKEEQATHDVYDLGIKAVLECFHSNESQTATYLGTGTTYSPLAAPGFASILHHRLQQQNQLNHPVEISSHAGICSSAAAALVGSIRAVQSGEHKTALCVGAEHASEVLKSSKIRPVDDRDQHKDLRNSQWFMSVFLRFMLSDGAGAFLLSHQPAEERLSLRINWTYSNSFAHTAPLCMKLDNTTGQLSQDIKVLSRFLVPCGGEALKRAFQHHQEELDSYSWILTHIFSFYFQRKMEKVIAEQCQDSANPVPYWTNLATRGNTGAASIFIMLDEFLKTQKLKEGDRILLFVPESGQFNFVFVSLTVVHP